MLFGLELLDGINQLVNTPLFIGFVLPLLGTICVPFIKLKVREVKIRDSNLTDWDIGIDFSMATAIILIVESINIQKRDLTLDPTNEQILMSKYMILYGISIALLIYFFEIWIVRWLIKKFFTPEQEMNITTKNKIRYKYGSIIITSIYGFLCGLIVFNILTESGGYW